ncbi:MAG: alpha/beta hydrolase [Myxococcota bacterium]|nr:alpha/beta hydrolase [Myxococcota bacterium]
MPAAVGQRPAGVYDAGTGPTVLLLHGVPTSGALWRPVATRLVDAGMRVIVPDLPGWGGSAPLNSNPTPAAHAVWLTQLLGMLRVSDPVVAGQDFGGLLALELLVRGTARAAALTSAWAGLGWMAARATALPGLERIFYRRYGGRLYISHGAAPDRQAAARATFGPALEDPRRVPQMRAIARGLSPYRLAPLAWKARRTGRPIRCIWGADDPFVPARASRLVGWQLGAAVDLIPGARHLAPFDRPDDFAAALLRFVESIQPDTA